MAGAFELDPAQLRCICDPSVFRFKDTSQIQPLYAVIGQQRAVEAIDFGLNMKSPGYNIFVTGIEGTGKSTIVGDIVKSHAREVKRPCDWCMVNNFKDDYRPKPVSTPPGKATRFAKQVAKLIEDLKAQLPQAFAEASFLERQSVLQKKFVDQKKELFQKIEKLAQEKQIQINQTKAGYETVPARDGQPMTNEQFEALSQTEKKAIEVNAAAVQSELEATVREVHKISLTQTAELESLMAEVTLFVAQHRITLIKEQYPDWPDILAFLDDIQTDIVENVAIFLPEPSDDEPDDGSGNNFAEHRPPFQQYKVNVLVDRAESPGAPVIFESNPTYINVFGQVEKRSYMGNLVTDFTMVQAGSLLQANGGYLIMEIEPVLSNPGVWEALKRTLQNKKLLIEDVASAAGFATASLRPEPIPLEVKVILLGALEPFEMLQNEDAKFNKIFRVRADFDYEVAACPDTIQQYARFIARVCLEENLLPFVPDGVAAIVEYGQKYTANKNKLSLRFGPIIGICKEADYWARKAGAHLVSAAHVVKAFTEYRFRYNLYEEKIHESYTDGTLLIDVDSAVVGQVNALAVYQMGDISFGRPSRITAEAFMGKEGILNIERNAKLSGKTHDKGVMVLSGYLGRTFAQRYPLNLSISLTFEQNYSEIDGDSASSTELYAILSALSAVAVRQGIAVTGSVNQKGQVQAIGGVNQKIEGFFDVCQSRGLTGAQGVMIPRINVQNLMLKRAVLDAAKAGRFHVWAVSTVEEGIEILTGVAAGAPDAQGTYPPGTVYGRVQHRLETFLRRGLRLKKHLAATD